MENIVCILLIIAVLGLMAVQIYVFKVFYSVLKCYMRQADKPAYPEITEDEQKEIEENNASAQKAFNDTVSFINSIMLDREDSDD